MNTSYFHSRNLSKTLIISHLCDLAPVRLEERLRALDVHAPVLVLLLLPLLVHLLELVLAQDLHHGRAVAVAEHVVGRTAAVTGITKGQLLFCSRQDENTNDLHKPVDGPEKRHILVGGVDRGEDDEHQDERG